MWMKLAVLIICCVITLWFIGQFPKCFMNKCASNICSIYVQGFLIVVCLFEIMEVPMALLRINLTTIAILWALVVIGLTLYVAIYKWNKRTINIPNIIKDFKIDYLQVLLLLLVLLHCILITSQNYRHYDDITFTGLGATAYFTDRVFLDNPYTGQELDTFFNNFGKYGLNGWYILPAAIGRLFSIHSTIVLRFVLGNLIVLLSYAVYWNIANLLFSEKKKKQIFLFIIMILQLCSAYYNDSAMYFYLNFPWIGKGIYANIIIPLIWYFGILSMKEDAADNKMGTSINWWWLFITSIVGIAVTSFAASLTPFIIASIMLFYTIKYKNIKNILYSCLMIIPSLLAIAIIKFF